MTVEYEARYRPTEITLANLGTDGSDPGVIPKIPSGHIESVLKPFFLKRWSVSPWFNNVEARPLIDEDYARALQIVSTWKPVERHELNLRSPWGI